MEELLQQMIIEIKAVRKETELLRQQSLSSQREIMDVKQTAEYLNVSSDTIRKWIETRKMPFSKVGGGSIRFKKSKLDRWMDRNEVPML